MHALTKRKKIIPRRWSSFMRLLASAEDCGRILARARFVTTIDEWKVAGSETGADAHAAGMGGRARRERILKALDREKKQEPLPDRRLVGDGLGTRSRSSTCCGSTSA